jgi:hypothetical protein
MPNEIEKIGEAIGHGVAVAARDVAHVAVECVEFPEKLDKVLTTVGQMQGPVRTSIQTLIADGKQVIESVLKDVGEKGMVILDDITTWEQIVAMCQEFKAAITAVEQAYAEINTDVA